MESLWWLKIFEKFIKDKLCTPIASGSLLNGDLTTLVSPIHKISHFQVIDKFNSLYFACMCRRCHKITRNYTKSVLSNSRYVIVCRMIVSALNRFKSLYHDSETNVLNEEDVQFVINKILITNCEINKILREIPVSYYYNLWHPKNKPDEFITFYQFK
ncbi:uncharacterized protein ELE39_001987 [Cryptosporidium sp. chipmunk genotype I]|uniref:uncharacterized protein n=1 Tax=Cryptosporidium sp. chipmunk genotype I TaxID=1280935 RepID=UPI00351A0294|nr:hypothetical protein ELE39_001987 [Cryptosporidium sp. chipmunk genotype I]